MTIDNKDILASSEGEEGGGGEEQQQDGIEEEEDSIAEDFLEGVVQRLEEDQLVSCSEEELLNPDTGECEESHLQEDIVANEICNNQEDDDLDGDVDLADIDCLPVFTNSTNSTSQEQMMSSPPSSLPISPGPDDLASSEGEEGGGGEEQQQDGIEGEEDSIADDFLEGVPSSSDESDLCLKESARLQLRDIPLPPQCMPGQGSSTFTPTDSQLQQQTVLPPIPIPPPLP